MKKYTTIKDIAKELNVSIATVSRALAGSELVSEDTKEKIIQLAERLNYRRNASALNLKSQRTKIIGIVVPELKSSFFPSVILGIEKVLQENGFQSIITQSDESAIKEEKNLRLLESNMVEGILLSVTKEGDNAALYKNIIDTGIPIVFFNRACFKLNASMVILDDYVMSFFATEHLIYNDFQKIIHFSGPKNLLVSKERIKGFIDAMKKHKRDVEDAVIESGLLSDDSYQVMKTMINKGDLPNAIFCFHDPIAFGILKAMKEVGLKCPDDIALVGFSESQIAELIDPPLTSVEQPTLEMGEAAARLLLNQLNHTNQKPEIIRFRGNFNIRKSSENPKKLPSELN